MSLRARWHQGIRTPNGPNGVENVRIGFPKLFTGWDGASNFRPQPQPVNNFAAGLVSVTFSPVADTNVTLFRVQRT
jgi:hypothetical protein